ncbi:MAG: hypothetical protein IH802_04090 [Nitrospinae bacterium]|nr:hypothetical protein [Nitrospinota bacterium]
MARATRNMVPQKPRRATDALDEALPIASDEAFNTLIVRAGAEDTLVLFLQDDTLQQSENLRSLTAYEAPETICSRVLLLQDEYGIGEVQHGLLLSEEREDDLIESFEMFFPEARVESLRQYDEFASLGNVVMSVRTNHQRSAPAGAAGIASLAFSPSAKAPLCSSTLRASLSRNSPDGSSQSPTMVA